MVKEIYFVVVHVRRVLKTEKIKAYYFVKNIQNKIIDHQNVKSHFTGEIKQSLS